jgi:LmbE family N-acetylglucosaminyl deacetylase
MLLETELVPYSLSMPPGERVVVLAPHPDDETLGMGGSLRILTESGKKVKVVILTAGEKADPKVTEKQEYSSTRKKEALKAFKMLGVTDYDFLGFPDRELLVNIDKVQSAVHAIVAAFHPDVIYSPSLIELNPDHRIAAQISSALSSAMDCRCIFYEVATPLRPNILVDISKLFKFKRKAVKCYKSQLKITDYLRIIEALNSYRSLTLGRTVLFAEAFWEVGTGESDEELGKWLSYKSTIM